MPAATATLAPNRVQVQANVSTQFYAVRGVTSEAIFAEMGSTGLMDDDGSKAIGLTSAGMSYSRTPKPSLGSCAVALMTIKLDVVVTLPQHENPAALPPSILRRWEALAAGVAAHEQRHVEIAEAGASALAEQMEALPYAPSCAALDEHIRAVWVAGLQATKSAQAAFHGEDDARVEAQRQPLQTRIEANQASIAGLAAEMAALGRTLAALPGKIEGLKAELAAVEAELGQIRTQYPSLVLPPAVYKRFEALREEYNALVDGINALVAEYNETLARRNNLVDKHNRLVGESGALVEELSWIV